MFHKKIVLHNFKCGTTGSDDDAECNGDGKGNRVDDLLSTKAGYDGDFLWKSRQLHACNFPKPEAEDWLLTCTTADEEGSLKDGSAL